MRRGGRGVGRGPANAVIQLAAVSESEPVTQDEIESSCSPSREAEMDEKSNGETCLRFHQLAT